MKRILSFAFAIIAIVSCSKVNPAEPIVSDAYTNPELSFTVAKALGVKAGEFEGTEFTNPDGFGAYAWFTGASVSEYWMKDVNVTKQLLEGKYAWKPVTPYYWPKDHTLDFLCYAPYNNGHCWFNITDNPANLAGEGVANLLTTHQVVNGTIADLLYSDKVLKCTNSAINEVEDGVNAYTGVPVIFRHALAKTSFQIKVDALLNTDQSVYAKVTFKNATLSNVHNEGDLTLNLTSNGATSSTKRWENKNSDGTWDTSDNTIDITDSIDGDLVVTKNPTDFIGETIIIPQNLDDQCMDLDIVIEFYDTTPFAKDPETGDVLIDPGTGMPYILVDNPEGGDPIKLGPNDPGFPAPTQSEPIHKHQDLDDIPNVDNWGMGDNTDYTITVTPFANEITFDPSVAIWDDTNAGGKISRGE